MDSLKIKVFNSIKWTTISTMYFAVTQLIQISIMARFLTSEELGTYAIIILVLGFCQMFVDLGFGNAVIFKKDINNEQLSTLYWLNILFSVFIYIVIYLLSPFIADFYNNENLGVYIKIIALMIIIQSIGRQFMSLFEKKLMFNFLGKVKMFASTVSLIVLTLLINLNFGIYSIILALITQYTIQTILYLFNGLKLNKPRFIINLSSVKELIHFGLYQTGSSIINYFNSQMDVILIGKLLGTETLGVYTVIKQIVMAPLQIINPIILKISFPTMSLFQNSKKDLSNIYCKTINYLSSINFPVYAFLIIFSSELLGLILGEQWKQHAYVFEILAIYYAFRATGNPIGSLVMATGKTSYEFYWNVMLAFYFPVVIYFASPYGLEVTSWALVVLILSLMIPNWYFLVYKLTGTTFTEYFLNIIKPFLITLFCFILCNYLALAINMVWLKFILVTTLGLIVLILLNLKFNKSFSNIIFDILKRK